MNARDREAWLGAAAGSSVDPSPDMPLRLPVIGEQSSLGDLLTLLGHAPAERAASFDHRFANRRVHRGQSLVDPNQRLENLYVVLSGSFKSTLTDADGFQQIVAFPMRGDLIGFDAVQHGYHPVNVSALEEANVSVIAYRDFVEISQVWPAFAQSLMKVVGGELLRNYRAMWALGLLGAEDRVAHFLRELGARVARFGFSVTNLRLPMTRADLASYLGMSIETVCRALASLAGRGLIDVQGRDIAIVDFERLARADDVGPGDRPWQPCGNARRRRQSPAAAAARHRAQLEPIVGSTLDGGWQPA